MQIILITLILVFVTSCTMSGAALSGAQALYNHRNLEKKFDENITTVKAYRKIYATDRFKNTNISIAAFDDKVLITGQIPNQLQKFEVAQIVRELAGERKVYDFTEEMSPCSYLTRASDSWITTKIKTQYIASKEIDPSLIKVITENGTVFLMGTVLTDQAEVATEIAENTAGVQKVVKLFSYMEIVNG